MVGRFAGKLYEQFIEINVEILQSYTHAPSRINVNEVGKRGENNAKYK